MPSCPRSEIVLDGVVACYHCWSRCVRGALLCGLDPSSGKNYEHRRDWVVEFEEQLAGLFGIDVAFHAEMSNHIHLILRTRPDVVARWSAEEVARRALTISHLVRSKDGKTIKPLTEKRIARETSNKKRIKKLRKRLSNISFFMGALCEYIARRSNREDGVTGRFWEGRFRCRSLDTLAAILACGIYVDLNQIRAREADKPETSFHTSAYQRILARQQRIRSQSGGGGPPPEKSPDGWLCELTLQDAIETAEEGPPRCARRASNRGILPLELDKYLELLDASGRLVRSDKPGSIPINLEPILDRLSIRKSLWRGLITKYDEWFGHCVGTSEVLRLRADRAGRSWYGGARRCAEVFG